MTLLDVVIVSFNSREHLRTCVAPLAGVPEARLIVVDNASTDGSLDVLADLPVQTLALPRNGGFAHGCNAGWRAGDSPFVLFVNPDATIEWSSVRRLTQVLEDDSRVGLVAPNLLHSDGSPIFCQRRFPSLLTTFAQALFLHRLFPGAAWSDGIVRDKDAYARAGSPDWVSGACMLVRRSALAQLDGFDEGFFLYCEEIDLCRRLRDAGFDVRYEPEAVCVHVGGASAPRAALLPILAASRVRYAQKHRGRLAALLDRVGIALGALTHSLIPRATGAGHVRALRVLFSRSPAAETSRWARSS